MENSKLFGKNIKYLRKDRNLNQDKMQAVTGVSRATWSDYERGHTQPNFEVLILVADFFSVGLDDLLRKDLEVEAANVHLTKGVYIPKKSENVHPIVHPIVHPKGQKEAYDHEFKITVLAEPDVNYGRKTAIIPITDISVAAGQGHYNADHVETLEALHLPPRLVKPGHTYLCVKIKGVSMSPTLQDGGFVVIRLLDKGDWAKMQDESIFVVVDKEGKSYLKRVKNRFKQGFIVLRSDTPDRASFPNFNLAIDEISSIWFVEWYFTAKMPNIHDQFYGRLQLLEDRVDELASKAVLKQS